MMTYAKTYGIPAALAVISIGVARSVTGSSGPAIRFAASTAAAGAALYLAKKLGASA